MRHNIDYFNSQREPGVGPRRRKQIHNIHMQQQATYDFLDSWFRLMIVARTSNLLQQKKLGEIKLLGSCLLTKKQYSDASYLQGLLIRTGELNILKQFTASFTDQERCLKDSATYMFARLLAPIDQRLVSCEIEQIIDEVSF